MRLRTTLLAATAIALASSANAANGWYMSLGAGWNWHNDADFSVGPGGSTYTGSVTYDTGYILAGAVGYDWGRWRAELEVAYRDNDFDCATVNRSGTCWNSSADEGNWEFSQMVNVLYDIPLGGRFNASVGAGIGGVLVVADQEMINYTGNVHLDDYVVAGQLIAQVGYDLSDRWQVYADYRYLLADDPESYSAQAGSPVSWEKSDHSVMIGMRFDLQADRAPMPPQQPQQPPQQPRSPKQFIVFFGFNKSNLTPEAERVVADAAAAAKEYGSASIMVVGHTDTVGSNRYNDALSMRRSAAVKSALAARGIPASAISTAGRGESELMVQTGDSVKEPQNRRATIDLN